MDSCPWQFQFSHVIWCILGHGGKKGAVENCGNCRGTGMQVRIQQLGPGMVQQIQSVCHECQGQGERINPKDRCKTCQGRKIVRERKILEVHIDKGTSTRITKFIRFVNLARTILYPLNVHYILQLIINMNRPNIISSRAELNHYHVEYDEQVDFH